MGELLGHLATIAVLLGLVGAVLFVMAAHWVHDLVGTRSLEVHDATVDELPLVQLGRADREAA
ncbi:hypothetical protein GV792_04890 [Nocardia cyriacigeorgica]|uniref:hypothetical protein n=1 Tax=Nocardia cyriacigeorgica TaxID=135487 RepID=UPI0013B72B43|nr:hypothetical protein [Nocardia cyriacigeorgica]NEW49380.1 hypothetical protein [Nocardia cyriacigeorgica]